MKAIVNPDRNQWQNICQRPSSLNDIVINRTKNIIERVRLDGDKALKELSLEIDKRELPSIRVSDKDVEDASMQVSEKVKNAISHAYGNIKKFHESQMPNIVDIETQNGVRCIQKPVPIQSIGLYIPGGTAPLFSTVLMLAIPALIAGCKSVELCTPLGPDGKVSPEVLYTANLCKIKDIYCVGGAQAIAAMAYGTETIEKVKKIFGPGNQYVTTAKQLLNGKVVAIDMPAGPSEVMVIADETSNPVFVAADLLSQAEHGKDSQVMLVTNSESIIDKVDDAIQEELQRLGRKELAESALSNSMAIVFSENEDIIDFANEYAPEHLIVSTSEPWSIVDRILTAGSVFVGQYTPESAGDYASGTNHTLPTCGWGHSFSGVNLDSFIRKMTVQEISQDGLKNLSNTIINMADAEGLQAHAEAVKVRM